MEQSPSGTSGPEGSLYCVKNKHWMEREAFSVKNTTTGELFKTCDGCRAKSSTPSGAQIGMMILEQKFEDVQVEVASHGEQLVQHDARLRALEGLGDGDLNILAADDEMGADIAEWLPLKDPDDDICAGDVVELVDGSLRKSVTGAGLIFVISTRPMFVGNQPSDAADHSRGRSVVLIGQAPVNTIGMVKAGMVLVPCGNGAASTVHPGAYAGNCKIIALESSHDVPGKVTAVKCLVIAGAADGVIAHAPDEVRSELEALRSKLCALEERLGAGGSDSDSWQHVSDGVLDASSCSDVTIDSTTFVPKGPPATSSNEGDHLETLASAHPCVRNLLVRFDALMSSMRSQQALLREPATRALQRVARGFLGRCSAKRDRERAFRAATIVQTVIRRVRGEALFSKTRSASVRVQALARRSAATARLGMAQAAQTMLASLSRKIIATRRFGAFRLSVLAVQTHARMTLSRSNYRAVRVAAIAISSRWRCYHVLAKTLIGNMLSRARFTYGELKQTKSQLDATKLELASLRERVEGETKNAVVAAVVNSLDQGGALATPLPSGHGRGRGAPSSVLERLLQRIGIGASGSLSPAIATMLAAVLKVTVRSVLLCDTGAAAGK